MLNIGINIAKYILPVYYRSGTLCINYMRIPLSDIIGTSFKYYVL